MTDGILSLNKPRGPTSHDIVGRVRALTGIRRVGHAGTLDPLATGVLLVCVGRATRVAEYLMAGRKVYRARVRLGITTDTYDAEGQMVTSVDPVEVDRAQVGEALSRFRGKIVQVPPMYSAIKHKGTPLHRLARRGLEVEREPRPVEIFRLELTGWEPPECVLEVACSPGTYVRALAHDLGRALGCGAHLAGLIRLASGGFHVEDAVTLEAFAQAAAEGRWPDLLHPMDAALTRFPALHLDADAARRLCLGQAIANCEIAGNRRLLANGELQSVDLVRVYGSDGAFLALAAYDPATDVWRPHKVFRTRHPESVEGPEG
ncbi:MAG: tRNA pseudouridine(55) synthase TruB [Chloroflexi bacterium]|nr:tRNA pseudouridine(55) synthase TruB [Chloroflexota bacterium]